MGIGLKRGSGLRVSSSVLKGNSLSRLAWGVLVVVLSLVGCSRSSEMAREPGNSKHTEVTPSGAGPVEGQFTCPGVPDTSVKAIFEDITLKGTEVGGASKSIRYLDCWGYSGNDRSSIVFYSEVSKVTPYRNHSSDYRGPGSETFSVPVKGASGDFRTMPEGAGVNSLITCGDVFIFVRIVSNRVPARGDLKTNVKNISSSMASWACKGEEIPGRGVPFNPNLPDASASASTSPETQMTESASSED